MQQIATTKPVFQKNFIKFLILVIEFSAENFTIIDVFNYMFLLADNKASLFNPWNKELASVIDSAYHIMVLCTYADKKKTDKQTDSGSNRETITPTSTSWVK